MARPTPNPPAAGLPPTGLAEAAGRPAAGPALGRPWVGVLGLLIAAACFRATQNMALTTFSLLAHDSVGLGVAEIGALAAVGAAVTVGVNLGVASRVPTERSRIAAAGGIGLVLPALALLATAHSFWQLGLGAVLLGVGGGVVFPALATAIGQVDPSARERALALFTLTLSASLAIGPLLESGILGMTGQDLRSPFFAFLLLPCLGVAALWLSGRFSYRGRTGPPALGAPVAQEEAALVGAVAASALPLRARAKAVVGRGPLGNPGWRVAVTAQLLYSVPFAAITVFGAVLARSAFGVTPEQAQLGFSCFFITSLAARALVAWRAPIPRKIPVLMGAGALTLAGLVLLATGHGFGLLLVAMGILGLPHGLTFPIVLAQVAASAGPQGLARANAALLAVSNSTSIVVPALLGLIIPVTGYRGMTLLLLLPVIGFGAALWGQRRFEFISDGVAAR
jgi:DHA1 family multidrug resistance protein-like MFS transporter